MKRHGLGVSHFTITQASKFVELSHSAVSQRVSNGDLKSIEVFGVTMVAVADCRKLWRDRLKLLRPKWEAAHVD